MGAPLQTTGTKRTGDVFRCPLDRGNSANCSRLQLGEYRLCVPFFEVNNPGEKMTTSRTASCTASRRSPSASSGKVSLDNVSERKDEMRLGMTLTSSPRDGTFVVSHMTIKEDHVTN